MRHAPVSRVLDALGAVDAWAPDLDPDDRYLGLAELVASGLPARVAHRLGGAPVRVGRSAVSMGVASRVWSLTVVPAVRSGIVVDPDAVCARDDDGAVVLGVRGGRGFTDVTADDLHDVVQAVLAPLGEALSLPRGLHWGNVAASLAAVPRVHGVSEAGPVVADLLARAPLAGLLGDVVGGQPGGVPRRRTCCLFYLAPRSGLCGDCVLDAVPSSA